MVKMILYEISVSLDLSILIIAGLFILGSIILLLVRCFNKKANIFIDGVEIGLNGICFHICKDKAVRQIAYKIWVEMNTRTICVKIDVDNDIIRAIHNSYYEFFKTTRELVKEIPVNNLKQTLELSNMIIEFLNNVMRPYLTKWGIKFNDWYDQKKEENKEKSPQELQKEYTNYDELINDLLCINKNVINLNKELEKIVLPRKKC